MISVLVLCVCVCVCVCVFLEDYTILRCSCSGVLCYWNIIISVTLSLGQPFGDICVLRCYEGMK